MKWIYIKWERKIIEKKETSNRHRSVDWQFPLNIYRVPYTFYLSFCFFFNICHFNCSDFTTDIYCGNKLWMKRTIMKSELNVNQFLIVFDGFISLHFFYSLWRNQENKEYTHLPLYSVQRTVVRHEELTEQSGYQGRVQPNC